MNLLPMKQASAWLPIAMSGIAMLALIAQIVFYGVAHEADEGALAHIWQLVMAMQVPVILYFAIRWVRSESRAALRVLVFQVTAAIAAIAPVFFLKL